MQGRFQGDTLSYQSSQYHSDFTLLPDAITDVLPDYLNTVPYFESLLEALNVSTSQGIASLDELAIQAVSGGDINDSSIVTLHDSDGHDSDGNKSSCFLKRNRIDSADVLYAEAIGLTTLRQAQVRTCQPLAMGIDKELGCSFLVLSLIYPNHTAKRRQQSTPTPHASMQASGWEDLAVQLARLHVALPPQPIDLQSQNFDADVSDDRRDSHLNKNEAHQTARLQKSNLLAHDVDVELRDSYAGFYVDNFIGSNPQVNTWTADWHAFFAEYRLGLQTKWAYDNQRISRETMQRIERLQHKLAEYLPSYTLTDDTGTPRPSLLHGDLWSGNAMIGHTSTQASDDALGFLIDPAVYVGHPETDIAMTRLFGGFSEEFYKTYAEYCPIESGFTERQDIYNLYHYLNHLNLFGSGYLSAVERIAKRFAK